MSERLTSLQRTVLAYKDPQELPKTDKFLIVETGALAGPMLIPVDTVTVSEHVIRGWTGQRVVIEFAPLYAWYVVPQDAVEAITHEEMLRRHKIDRDEARKLNKELWGNDEGDNGFVEDGPKPVGQYL